MTQLCTPIYFRSNKGKALFKRQQENSSNASVPRSPLSKVASESDLTQSLNLPQVNGDEVEPISITVNATFAKQVGFDLNRDFRVGRLSLTVN